MDWGATHTYTQRDKDICDLRLAFLRLRFHAKRVTKTMKSTLVLSVERNSVCVPQIHQ